MTEETTTRNRAFLNTYYQPPQPRHEVTGDYGERIEFVMRDTDLELRQTVMMTVHDSPMNTRHGDYGAYQLRRTIEVNDYRYGGPNQMYTYVRRLCDEMLARYKRELNEWTFHNHIPGLIGTHEGFHLYEVRQEPESTERVFRVHQIRGYNEYMEFTVPRQELIDRYYPSVDRLKNYLTEQFQKVVALILHGEIQLSMPPRGGSFYAYHETGNGLRAARFADGDVYLPRPRNHNELMYDTLMGRNRRW